jgi:hypothetical protein
MITMYMVTGANSPCRTLFISATALFYDALLCIAMAPFSKPDQVIHDFDITAGNSPLTTLPGYPFVGTDNVALVQEFLTTEYVCQDLEDMAPRLWIMTTPCSGNINPLHRQRVKGREIVITEEPRLHLLWIHDRIFIKPLPRYLLSHTFWTKFVDRSAGTKPSPIVTRKAMLGFLRTYRYLILHESDFIIAQQDNLRLIPRDIKWESFCQLMSSLDIEDSTVSERYSYGELRLTRLNFYAPFLLRKFHFEQVHGQYSDFFGRMFGPVLFCFALVTTVLNSMQVALAVEQLITPKWERFWHLSRWFSVISLIAASIISVWLACLWLWIFLDEWIYTVRRRAERRRLARTTSKC